MRGTIGSVNGAPSVTHVTTSVWLIIKDIVLSACPGGGNILSSNGLRADVSSRAAFELADPLTNIQLLARSSIISAVELSPV